MKAIIPILAIAMIAPAISQARPGQKHGRGAIDGYNNPTVFKGKKASKSKTSSKQSSQSTTSKGSTALSDIVASVASESNPLPGSDFAVKLKSFKEEMQGRQAPKKTGYEEETSSKLEKNKVSKNRSTAPTGNSGGGNGDEFALEVNYEGINEEVPGIPVSLQTVEGQEFLVSRDGSIRLPASRLDQGETTRLWDQGRILAKGSDGRGLSIGKVNGNARPEVIGVDLGALVDMRQYGMTADAASYYNLTTEETENRWLSGDYSSRKILLRRDGNGGWVIAGGGGGGGAQDTDPGEAPNGT